MCRSASPCVAGVASVAAAKIHKMALLSLSIFLRKLATNHRVRLTKIQTTPTHAIFAKTHRMLYLGESFAKEP